MRNQIVIIYDSTLLNITFSFPDRNLKLAVRKDNVVFAAFTKNHDVISHSIDGPLCAVKMWMKALVAQQTDIQCVYWKNCDGSYAIKIKDALVQNQSN